VIISDTALLLVSTLSFRYWPERMFNLCRYYFRTKCKVRFFFSHFDILEIGLPNWHSHRTTIDGETNKFSPQCINHVKMPKMNLSYKKWRIIAWNQGGNEYPAYNKMKED